MNIYKSPLRSVNQTGEQCARLVNLYYKDIGSLKYLPLEKYFNLVKKLPYLSDPNGTEFLSRPKASLNPRAIYRDCDDKAILMGAYFKNNGIKSRFLAVSTDPKNKKKLHHCVVEAFLNGSWEIIDPTYSKNPFPKPEKEIYRKVIISEVI
jgi:hypothetical protein